MTTQRRKKYRDLLITFCDKQFPDLSLDKFIYLGANIRGIVLCPIHGSFLKSANGLKNGAGCPDCGKKAGPQTIIRNKGKTFTKRANIAHNGYYTYSNFIYTGVYDKSYITCPKHGDFLQQPNNHLTGYGCDLCGREGKTSGFDILKPGTWYYLKDTENGLYKSGITNRTVQARFKKKNAPKFVILKEVLFQNGKLPLLFENFLKKEYESERVINENFRVTGGHTEFFKKDILNLDKKGKNYMEKLCVINMSGGIDSATLAYKAIEDGYTILPINVNYGQKNIVEQAAFEKVYKEIKKTFISKVLDPIIIDLNLIIGPILKSWANARDSGDMLERTGHEFYTPSRNLLFSVFAAHVGEVLANQKSLGEIKIGLGVHKHSSEIYKKGDYWDISPEFVTKLNDLFKLNDCIGVSMYAPYASKTKDEIVKDAVRLGVPYRQTWTCYNPIQVGNIYMPCHVCEACIERQKAGDRAGVKDINDYDLEL